MIRSIHQPHLHPTERWSSQFLYCVRITLYGVFTQLMLSRGFAAPRLSWVLALFLGLKVNALLPRHPI